MTPLELARQTMLSQGIRTTGRLLTDIEAVLIVLDILTAGHRYYSSATLSDASAILDALNQFRLYINAHDDELAAVLRLLKVGPVPDKNMALIDIFERYLEAMKTAQVRPVHPGFPPTHNYAGGVVFSAS